MIRVFAVFVLIMVAVVAVAMMGEELGESPTHATAKPTEIRQKMEQAHSNGATLFQYKRDVVGMALCNGNQWIADLDTSVKEIKLTSYEAANLTLCKYDLETKAYFVMQEINWTNPGDYLVWESSGLCGLKYE